MVFSPMMSRGASMPGGVSFVMGTLVAGLNTVVAHPLNATARAAIASAIIGRPRAVLEWNDVTSHLHHLGPGGRAAG